MEGSASMAAIARVTAPHISAGLDRRPAAASSDGTAPAPMSARVVLPSRTMTAGSSMSGYVLVENHTEHAVHASGCLTLFQVLLTSSTYRPTAAWFLCLQPFTIPIGETRYSATVSASYNQCHQGRPQHGLRACLPGGRPPPLPPGDYHATLFQVGHLVRVPPAITVRVTLPARPRR